MSNIITYLQSSKSAISSYLIAYLQKNSMSFPEDTPWKDDVHSRVAPFAISGKMIRGSLVLLSARMFGETLSDAHYQAAVAEELLQTALLIQDDVMDKDYFRRGNVSLFAQYEKMAKIQGIPDAQHFGNGMAICVGDISIFTAFALLAEVSNSLKVGSRLTHYFSQESQKVAYGQMQDYYFGKSQYNPKEKEILAVYYYKTGTYTFSLPLGMGAILAKQSDRVIVDLQKLSKHLSYIFQIRDDELNYLGKEVKTGKSAGSDITNNIKTLHRLYLYEMVNQTEKKNLDAIFGKQKLSEQELQYVQSLLHTTGVIERINIFLSEEKVHAENIIQHLSIGDADKTLLQDLLDYLYKRSK